MKLDFFRRRERLTYHCIATWRNFINLTLTIITEQIFQKQILGNCQSIVESLGAIRNKLGDAHGQGPIRAKPQPRHAELAVRLACWMSTFLIATWRWRRESRATEPVATM